MQKVDSQQARETKGTTTHDKTDQTRTTAAATTTPQLGKDKNNEVKMKKMKALLKRT